MANKKNWIIQETKISIEVKRLFLLSNKFFVQEPHQINRLFLLSTFLTFYTAKKIDCEEMKRFKPFKKS